MESALQLTLFDRSRKTPVLTDVGRAVLEDARGRIWAITDKGPAIFQPDVDRDPPVGTIRKWGRGARSALM